jgi:hypothetical protein
MTCLLIPVIDCALHQWHQVYDGISIGIISNNDGV